ncbi:MAG: HNH endonuclease [Trueperaceae bacterium]
MHQDPSHQRVHEHLITLPPLHRQALLWFHERTGEVHGWPGTVDLPAGRTYLASTPKGIYKPRWTHHALSVRQSLDGPYADQITRRPDGTWQVAYFQEGFDLDDARTKATNRGLLACLVDSVPVGVFRQVSRNPHRYEILGLALVATFDGGFFFLEGAAATGTVRMPGTASEFERLQELRASVLHAAKSSAPEVVAPLLARERTFTEILRRRGQVAFRDQLLSAYDARCAMTCYDAPEALEAAHIVPYADDGLSTAKNGLLLRADLHTLFDVGLVGVHPSELTIGLHASLAGTRYEPLHDARISLPRNPALRPDGDFLESHAEWSGLFRR